MQYIPRPVLTLLVMAIIFFGVPCQANAQSDQSDDDTVQHWTEGATFNLSFSQVSLDNWVGGGSSSISLNGVSNLFLNYEKGDKTWRNNLDIAYGLINTEEQETFRKSDDNFNFSTNYSHDMSEHWSFAALLDFKTVMTPGYRYSEDSVGEEQRTLTSDFMAPGYVITSAGFTYQPSEGFRFMGSPLTGKTTFLLNDELAEGGGFGVEPGEHVRQEIGSNVNIFIERMLMKNVSLRTEANFFSNYETPTEIDVNWNARLGLKINDYLSATITAHMIYDEDIDITRDDGSTGPAVQLKEVLAIGFNYQI